MDIHQVNGKITMNMELREATLVYYGLSSIIIDLRERVSLEEHYGLDERVKELRTTLNEVSEVMEQLKAFMIKEFKEIL